MPQAESDSGRFLLEQLQSGTGSRLILMAISQSGLTRHTPGLPQGQQQLVDLSNTFTQRLRGTNLFSEVNNGAGVLDKSTLDLLFRYRYLLSPNVTTAYFSAENLREVLARRYQELASPIAAVGTQRLGQDPGNDYFRVLSGLQMPNIQTQNSVMAPLQRRVWISDKEGMAFILAKTRADGFALEEQQVIQQNISELFATMDNNKGYTLQLSGPSVIAVSTQSQIKNDVRKLTLIASGVVVLLLLVAYRSILIVMVNILPLATAMLLASACTALLFHDVHGITFAFGMTIIGVAIDYPIHVFSHLSGTDNAERDMQRIWPTLRLGVFTTCSGYLALVATDFNGLSQLAVFSISGLMSAMLFTRWVLPIFLHGRIGRYKQAVVPDVVALRLLTTTRAKRIGAILIAVMTMVIIVMNRGQIWEQDIAALSPIPKQAIQLDRHLRAAMGVADFSHLLVVQAADLESVLVRNEALQDRLPQLMDSKIIQGFDSVSHYLPSQQRQRQRQEALPDSQTLTQRVKSAMHGLPFKRDLFEPFIKAVQESRHMPLLTPKDFDNSMLSTRLDSLLLQQEGQWLAVLPLFGLADEAKLRQWLGESGFNYVRYINIKSETNQLVADFRDHALQRIHWSAILIIAVLWLGLRSVTSLVYVIVPVLASMAFSVAILMLAGQALSLFNLVALLLVLGIGVDYSLFFNRDDSEYHHRQQTLHALIVCAISTASVFGILSLSQIPVLQDIGGTVASGVIASFFFSMAIAQRKTHANVSMQKRNRN